MHFYSWLTVCISCGRSFLFLLEEVSWTEMRRILWHRWKSLLQNAISSSLQNRLGSSDLLMLGQDPGKIVVKSPRPSYIERRQDSLKKCKRKSVGFSPSVGISVAVFSSLGGWSISKVGRSPNAYLTSTLPLFHFINTSHVSEIRSCSFSCWVLELPSSLQTLKAEARRPPWLLEQNSASWMTQLRMDQTCSSEMELLFPLCVSRDDVIRVITHLYFQGASKELITCVKP